MSALGIAAAIATIVSAVLAVIQEMRVWRRRLNKKRPLRAPLITAYMPDWGSVFRLARRHPVLIVVLSAPGANVARRKTGRKMAYNELLEVP